MPIAQADVPVVCDSPPLVPVAMLRVPMLPATDAVPLPVAGAGEFVLIPVCSNVY